MKEFDEIYREYYDPLYGFLLKLTGGEACIAEELTQETFFQVYLSLHRFRGQCRFFTWLCQVAKNTYFKYLRKHREIAMDISLLQGELTESRDNVEDFCERKQLRQELRKAILDLPKKQRDVLLLRVYFELPFQEIGKLLRIEDQAAKVRYHRGKEALKKMMQNRYEK
ncbi:MAG: sigma-70 family RNA polymerase sigma factor [Lachnospiraceae bacterium]|nr:sigma-70 family RNA polymerase sigma factor [Lachnospiraceae bacterium]